MRGNGRLALLARMVGWSYDTAAGEPPSGSLLATLDRGPWQASVVAMAGKRVALWPGTNQAIDLVRPDVREELGRLFDLASVPTEALGHSVHMGAWLYAKEVMGWAPIAACDLHVGHSLGGTAAALCGFARNRPSVTFGAFRAFHGDPPLIRSFALVAERDPIPAYPPGVWAIGGEIIDLTETSLATEGSSLLDAHHPESYARLIEAAAPIPVPPWL